MSEFKKQNKISKIRKERVRQAGASEAGFLEQAVGVQQREGRVMSS